MSAATHLPAPWGESPAWGHADPARHLGELPAGLARRLAATGAYAWEGEALRERATGLAHRVAPEGWPTVTLTEAEASEALAHSDHVPIRAADGRLLAVRDAGTGVVRLVR